MVSALEVEEDLDQAVDLLLRHVPEVAELHHLRLDGGVRDVLHADRRVVQHGDAAAPLGVQQLVPVDLVRLLLDDLAVVAHRVHVEVVRRHVDEPGLVARHLARGGVGPARELAVLGHVHLSERRVAVADRAVGVVLVRLDLAGLVELSDLVPALNLLGGDRDHVPARPDLVDVVVVAGEDVEGLRLRDDLVPAGDGVGDVEREREAERLLRRLFDRVDEVDSEPRDADRPGELLRLLGARLLRSSPAALVVAAAGGEQTPDAERAGACQASLDERAPGDALRLHPLEPVPLSHGDPPFSSPTAGELGVRTARGAGFRDEPMRAATDI
jgi:hypothetical protein